MMPQPSTRSAPVSFQQESIGRPSALHQLSIALLLFSMAASAWADTPILRVLAWPGYAEPELVKRFEQEHQVRVELTIITTDASLWEKASEHNQGIDVFAVNAAELQRYINANLVQPLIPEKIPNTHRQLTRFRDLSAIPGLTRHGKSYGIPYTYSQMGLIYDKKQIDTPPKSISSLWDPRYRKKVIAYDGGTHNFSLAAQSLKFASPFRISPKDFPRATEKLIALRRNALAFYTQPEESVQLFMRHGAALMFANYGMQQVQLLRNAGMDIGYVIPREGALAWLDCWVISRDSRNTELAHAWINHMLEPLAGQLLAEHQGLNNTLSDQTEGQTDELSVWLEPPEETALREKLWERIRSGDRLVRVLAP